jgi:glycosyltransferase involved in cell wall biosynthesis/ribosomal protein S18 acetylase RimI-like enzyme
MNRPVRVAHLTTVDLTLRFLLLGQLKAIRDEGFEVAGISAPGPWSPGLEAEGIRHIPWRHATRAWSPSSDAKAVRELIAILRRERFDVLHTHNPKPGILGRLAGRFTGVPCIVNTVHGLYASPDDRPPRKLPVLAVEGLAARVSDLELYQSEEDLAWARRIGVVDARGSTLLGNGIDVRDFDPAQAGPERLAALREELRIPPGATVIGTVGRLVAEKGYRQLFAAAREIRRRRGEVCFLAIGGTDLHKKDAISEEELERARRDVTFTGWREDVRDLLALMDVFVLASWREGMPRSAIEAAAMARPLVLTDIRGCREVARHGKEAILVPPQEHIPLALAIDRLLGDRALRERLGAAARTRAVERFDERRVVAIVLDRYRELLSRRGIRPPPGDDRLRLRPARPADASSLARLHREALPDAFLPALGQRFMEVLYRALVDDPGAVSFVAERGGVVVGFATGVVSTRTFWRTFCTQQGPRAMGTAWPRLLRPAVARRAVETARYAGRDGKPRDPELLAIAVAPAERRRGVGRMLAGGVLSGLAELGAERVRVLAAADNREANALYSGMGFRPIARFALHDGIESNLWVTECHS